MSQPRFRPARPDELWDILEWRNAERVRKAMLTQQEINRDEHAVWWQRKLSDHSFRQMIIEDGGTPLAVQAFFDIRTEKTAWWAFYFTPAVPDDLVQMMRIWKSVELAGVSYAFEGLHLKTLYCEVLRSNPGVLNWHKRFGFQTCDSSISDNTPNFDLEVMSMDREGYNKLRLSRVGADIATITFDPHPFDAKSDTPFT